MWSGSVRVNYPHIHETHRLSVEFKFISDFLCIEGQDFWKNSVNIYLFNIIMI